MKYLKEGLFVILIVVVCACNKKVEQKQEVLKVHKDDTFNKFFHKDSAGVTGADGTISVSFPDGSSVFMMGDSFLGKVIDKKRDSNTKMINNTFVVINSEKTDAKAVYNGEYDDPKAIVNSESGKDTFYWPGHGFVHDGVFHFFMSKFQKSTDIEDTWGFKFIGTDYFRYKAGNFEKISSEPFTYTQQNNVHWGHAVLKEGKYIYIYGTKVEEDVVARAYVCRTTLDLNNKLNFSNVEFFDGVNWDKDPLACKSMSGTSSNISEQFSVFKYKQKYVLLSQQRGIGEGAIYTYTSNSPNGPWMNKKMIYETKEASIDKDLITYNAMAHPQYIEDDQLLICYNVNSLKVPRIFSNVECYRPVFLRVPMKMILDN